jgi:purine nucleoside phosphorylase
MSAAYDAQLRRKMQNIAERNNIKLFSGVYIMVLGPNYETPSEIKLFKNFGADAVGMSTVPEVLAAVQQGIKVLGISSISNYGTGLTEKPQNHEDVMITVAESIETLSFLIRCFLEEE